MARPRKHHRQQSFAMFAKPLDKNGQLRGARKGEKRRGVGRPKQGARASERHQPRLPMRANQVAHVILRASPEVGSLRRPDVFHAIREALITVARLEDVVRVVHFSVQATHIHLLVEAVDERALAKGMKVFGISAAMHINGCTRDREGRRRRGAVFPDRYHVRILQHPRDVRNTLAYVLNNWRHHRADRGRTWKIDPYSSAITFDGWKELAYRGGRFVQPPRLVAPLVWEPRTWLARVGWQRRGAISVYEVPGGDE
ncbi:MAG TPA: hypothetical protein VG916_00595 [Gemmatimonadaceae bacterium]|nr:hypothetical protein [Gemmatimonadaceae bacterium]